MEFSGCKVLPCSSISALISALASPDADILLIVTLCHAHLYGCCGAEFKYLMRRYGFSLYNDRLGGVLCKRWEQFTALRCNAALITSSLLLQKNPPVSFNKGCHEKSCLSRETVNVFGAGLGIDDFLTAVKAEVARQHIGNGAGKGEINQLA